MTVRTPSTLVRATGFVVCSVSACAGSAATPTTNAPREPAAARAEAGSAVGDDRQSNPRNCGVPGQDCVGGACEAGRCVPLAPGVLASGQHTPAGIVVDATSVYWINRGSYAKADGTYGGAELVKCAKSGCNNAPAVLATGAWTEITNLVVSGSRVYWGASGKVFACPTDGCGGEPTVLWAGAGGVGEIAVDGARIYFFRVGSAQVNACPIEGCDGDAATAFSIAPDASPAPQFVFARQPIAFALGPDALYLVTVGSVLACVRSRCSETLHSLAAGSLFAPVIAVDATSAYFVESGLFAANWSDQRLTLLLFDVSDASAIAVDGTTIYVAQRGGPDKAGTRRSGAGRIAECSVAGCSQRPTIVQDYVNYPQGIALDDRRVYWTDFGSGTDPSGSDDGRVMFRPK